MALIDIVCIPTMPSAPRLMPSAMPLLLALALLLAPVPPSLAGAAPDAAGGIARYVVEIQAITPDLLLSTGSAVSIAPGRLVTNCHVIRGAEHIWVLANGQRWKASTEVRDTHRDLCILDVPDYRSEIASVSDPTTTKVGIAVVAAGYSNKRFKVTQGEIKHLYTCPCDGGRVIQTSATFDHGASGGGLFDTKGRLVGILTFKSTKGGDFHFAVPVSWLAHLDQQGVTSHHGDKPFWEQKPSNSGYFLTACALEANEDWPHLAHLAGEWSRNQPNDPEAWMALGRANLGLSHLQEAAKDFQYVIMLDPANADAEWELQKLEFDLGESLISPANETPLAK
jgi:serine protease Do